VCVCLLAQNRQTTKKKASRETNTQETTKITKENSTGTKHKWKCAQCNHVKKGKKSCEAESFKRMEIIYPTHLKMAM
jgi:hypothetical protein